MQMNQNMKDYYAKRAREYEAIYHRADPKREKAQQDVAKAVQHALKGRDVLEIACGTGYWTEYTSQVAKNITATDINPEVIAVAQKKEYKCPVTFEIVDAYALPFDPYSFTGGLANFWFSHLPKERVDEFLTNFHHKLANGSPVFLADNVLWGDPQELVHKENDENTYRVRKLTDGTEHMIIKNYYSVEQLVEIFQRHLPSFSAKNVHLDPYFWTVSYTLDK